MNEIGKPLFFDLEVYKQAVIGMIRADELQFALTMLDNLPGYYRDLPPAWVAEIRATIYRQTYDSIEYATDDDEANCTREFGEAQWTNGYMHPRAEIIAKLVREINGQGMVPWLYDLGASHGNLPLGLLQEKLEFTYCGVGMNHRILQKVKGWVGSKWRNTPLADQANPKAGQNLSILYNTEVIEHMMNPLDAVHSSHKPGIDWHYILLSVPMYTLGGGLPDWDTRRMGHVRTWTPREFADFADKHWPGYKWEMTLSHSMVIVGKR